MNIIRDALFKEGHICAAAEDTMQPRSVCVEIQGRPMAALFYKSVGRARA